MCAIDGLDEYDRVNVTRERQARKQHNCDECHRLIESGERYQITSGIDSEGKPFAYKVCGHCMVVCSWLSDNCGGWVRSGVFEDIAEHVEEYRRMDLARLTVSMRNKWKHIRRDGLVQIPALPRLLQIKDAKPWNGTTVMSPLP